MIFNSLFIKGVRGRNCKELLHPSQNPCLINPCWNGGTCSVVDGKWSCKCPGSFFGNNCKGVVSSPCIKNNPCKNAGICQLIGGTSN